MDGMNENRMPKLFVCIVQRGKTQDTCCQKRQKNLATSWIKIAFCSFLKMRLNWLRLELLDLFLSWQTQQEQRKLACAMPNAAIYCLSKKDDSYCCLFLFIHRIIFYMCKRHVLPQIAQITQRNTASCIISQRKTGWN